jgi:hypothetical protein
MLRRNFAHGFDTSFTALLSESRCGVFRSGRLVIGTLTTCSSAVLLALLAQSLFGRKIGILTANLSTIVFVVALSHLVYMTFNWQTLASRSKTGR